MGILGRKRASRPAEANAHGMKVLICQLASPDPRLRFLAVEAQNLALRPKTRLQVP